MKPIVTWILCTNTHNEYLHLAIDSCLNQTFEDFELLVIANGHDSESIMVSVLERYGSNEKVRVIRSALKHLVHSLNYGLEMSRGEYIARMDSDDISHPDRLKRQVEFMVNNADVGVLGTSYDIIDEHGNFVRRIESIGQNNDIRTSLTYRNPIAHPTVLAKRELLLSVGGYMGGLHSEDYNLWCRISLDQSVKFANISDPLLKYRIATDGLARRSRHAYANQAATQLYMLLITKSPKWIIGIFISVAKCIFKSK